jgi:hypothetical protein
MPVKAMDNQLAGLALKQLSRHRDKDTCFKPWQVPEDNFIFVKIPPVPEEKGTLVTGFTFDQATEAWQPVGVGIKPGQLTGFDWTSGPDCYRGGCLMMAANASHYDFPARFTSEPIPVEPGERYTAEGWLKSIEPNEDQKRAGFIRLDFYEDENLNNGQRGQIAAVSGRNLIDGQWQQQSVSETAPENAKFLRVSVSHQSPVVGYLFDEIKLYQSPATQAEKDAANAPEINDHQAYPEVIL